MVDNQMDQSAMVKTAILANVEGVPENQTTPLTWLDIESSVGQDIKKTAAQQDGFRYETNE